MPRLTDALVELNVPQGVTATPTQIDDAVAKSLTPSKLVTFLPDTSDYTTPVISAGVPTKVLIPTTVKSIQDFELYDKGGGDFAYRYIGSTTKVFAVNMRTSMTTSANNIVVAFNTYKNEVKEQGLSAKRKIGTGADVGALGITGEIELSTNDIIELYILNDISGSITFIETSINICERN